MIVDGLIFFFWLALSAVLASAVHELGHAAGLWLCDRRPLVVQIGSGSRALAIPRDRTRLLFSWSWPLGGRCCSDDRQPPSLRAQAVERLAGSAANLLFAGALWLSGADGIVVFALIVMQLALGVSQLLPWPQHDGAVWLDLLRGQAPSVQDALEVEAEARWLRGLGHHAAADYRRRSLAKATPLAGAPR